MTEPVELADIKADLRLGSSTVEDARLSRLIAAARRAVERRIGYIVVGDDRDLPDRDLPTVCQAITLIVGTWYALPEGVAIDGRASDVELPLGVSWLLDPVKKWPDE